MSNPERQQNRRWRARNAVAISVVFAGLTAGTAVAEHASAAAPASPAIQAAATSSKKAVGLVTAAPVPVTGKTADGTALNGVFTLQRFQAQGGVMYAVGKLAGTLGGQAVTQTVRLPVSTATNDAGTTGTTGTAAQPNGLRAAQVTPTPGACSILNLHLGALDLNLLGLHVALDPVNLLVEAVPGADALLGNLLCAVAGLLDGAGLGGLSGILTNLLNAILGILQA
jgi:hypothetical protein